MLTRPYLAVLAPAIVVVLWSDLSAAGVSRSKSFGAAAVVLGAFVVVWLPWGLHNLEVAKQEDRAWVALRSYGSAPPYTNLYTPNVRAWFRSYDEPFRWPRWDRPPDANYLTEGERRSVAEMWRYLAANEGRVTPEMDAEFGRITEARYREAPLRLYVWRPVSLALKLWFSPRASALRFGDRPRPAWVRWSVFGINALTSLLAVAGIVLVRRRRDRVFLAAGPVLLTIGLVVLAARETRYVMPMYPFVVVAAALAIDALWRRWRRAPLEDSESAPPGSALRSSGRAC